MFKINILILNIKKWNYLLELVKILIYFNNIHNWISDHTYILIKYF